MKTVKLEIVGTRPIMTQCPRLVDPLHPMKKEIAKLTGKRKKTDEDLIEIARLEYVSFCYYDEKRDKKDVTKRWYLPAEFAIASFRDAAKEFRQGKATEKAIAIVEYDLPFLFPDNDKTPDQLFENRENNGYVDARNVVIKQARLPRYRPVFPEWSTALTVMLDEETLSYDDLIKIVELAGRQNGFGTYRQKFGRFSVKVVK